MSEPLLMRSGLSLERLETFIRVAETGSMVKAAGGDPVRQSLYSRQIRELSEFFGAELFQRDGRGIKLTAAGIRLAQLAREQFAALRDFQHEAKGSLTTLTVGAGNSILEWELTPVLPGLCRKLPGVQIALMNRRSKDIVRDLQELRLDLGVVRKDALLKGLKARSFLTVHYGIFAPQKLVKGRTDQWIMENFDRFPLALTAGESFQPQFIAASKKAGFTCRVTVSCSSFSQAAELVASGEFVAVLPLTARKRLPVDDYRLVEATFLKHCSRELSLAWHPRLEAVRPVVKQAVAVFGTYWGQNAKSQT